MDKDNGVLSPIALCGLTSLYSVRHSGADHGQTAMRPDRVLRSRDLDTPADGQIERIMLFETDT
jgi:hypothetical protein